MVPLKACIYFLIKGDNWYYGLGELLNGQLVYGGVVSLRRSGQFMEERLVCGGLLTDVNQSRNYLGIELGAPDYRSQRCGE